MKKLYIIGAGGYGREVLAWAMHLEGAQQEWRIAGFLDANPEALKGYSTPVGVVGDPDGFVPSEDDRFVCAIGETSDKLRVCRALRGRGGKFITLIHPTSVIGLNCRIGEGCLLCPGSVLTSDVTLGEFVSLNVHASVGHDAIIGDGCTLNAHTDVTGFARLGEGVFMGSHATVLPGATVGDFAVIGAGSVVLRKVPGHCTVLGVPARKVYGFGKKK